MAQPGAIHQAVGGSLVTPFGDNGIVVTIKRGIGVVTPTEVLNVSGPADGGDPVFTSGNNVFSVQLIGESREGTANVTAVTYTHATKTLSKADAFKFVNVGQYIYVSGGTNATAGWYKIATNADDNTVTLETAPGTGNQTDFTLNGLNTVAGPPNKGPCTIQFGNGETWTGTILMTQRRIISDWDNPQTIGLFISGTFTGSKTITTSAV